jgi:hypothetical protein
MSHAAAIAPFRDATETRTGLRTSVASRGDHREVRRKRALGCALPSHFEEVR